MNSNRSDRSPQPNPRNRRWYQFGFRFLLIGIVVLAIGLAWLTNEVYRAKTEREFAEHIEQLGGTYHFDYEADKHGNSRVFMGRPPTPPAPRSLREWFGENLFSRLGYLEYQSDEEIENDRRVLNQISQMTGLK